jgi:hypothetical protein
MAFLPTEEHQMQFVHFVVLLQNYESNRNKVITTLSKVLTTLTMFFAAVEEGLNKAAQYEVLARKSDSELEDLPRFVMFGKTKEQPLAHSSAADPEIVGEISEHRCVRQLQKGRGERCLSF